MGGKGAGGGRAAYRVCISAITLSSFSTAEIFSAEVGWRAPRPKRDILWFWGGGGLVLWVVVVVVVLVLGLVAVVLVMMMMMLLWFLDGRDVGGDFSAVGGGCLGGEGGVGFGGVGGRRYMGACLGRRLDSLSTGTVSTGTESEILVHFYFVLNTVLSP